MRQVSTLALSALALAATAMGAFAQDYDRRWRDDQRDRWESLGTQSVGFQRSVVRPRFEGERYETIVLLARDGRVFVKGVDVIFERGERQHFDLDDTLAAGERSRPLRIEGFQGEGRRVREIELTYSAVAGNGTLEVFAERRGFGGGRPPGRDEGREGWSQIACEHVKFLADHDVINLPQNDNRFRAIRLRVEGATVDVRNVRVTFGTGETQNNWPPMVLKSGEFSPPLRFAEERGRRVYRIDLDYATRPSLRGEATACVDGLR